MGALPKWSAFFCVLCGHKLAQGPHPDTQLTVYQCSKGHLWKRTPDSEHVREAWHEVKPEEFYAFKPEAHEQPAKA
jgi:hypothetical protein